MAESYSGCHYGSGVFLVFLILILLILGLFCFPYFGYEK